MLLNISEILASRCPFNDFAKNVDTFSQILPVVNSMDRIHRVHLTTNILLDCPDECLPLLESNIQSINEKNPQEIKDDSFISLMRRAYLVRKLISSITDATNPAPIAYWLSDKFDATIFDEFRLLTDNLVEKNSEALLRVFMQYENSPVLLHRVPATFKESKFLTNFNLSLMGCLRESNLVNSAEKNINTPPPITLAPRNQPQSDFFKTTVNRKASQSAQDQSVRPQKVTDNITNDSCVDGCFGFLGL